MRFGSMLKGFGSEEGADRGVEEDDTAVMLEPLEDLGTACPSSVDPIPPKVSDS